MEFVALEIVAEAGRNKHGQRLVRARCACGREFEVLFNNLKQARTKSCGQCPRKKRPVAKLLGIPAPIVRLEDTERGSIEWFRAQIALKTEAATKLESQANEFEAEMKERGVQSDDVDAADRLWARATNTAKKLRGEISRLLTEMQKVEMVKAKPTDPRQVTRDRIAALKGNQ